MNFFSNLKSNLKPFKLMTYFREKMFLTSGKRNSLRILYNFRKRNVKLIFTFQRGMKFDSNITFSHFNTVCLLFKIIWNRIFNFEPGEVYISAN